MFHCHSIHTAIHEDGIVGEAEVCAETSEEDTRYLGYHTGAGPGGMTIRL